MIVIRNKFKLAYNDLGPHKFFRLQRAFIPPAVHVSRFCSAKRWHPYVAIVRIRVVNKHHCISISGEYERITTGHL